MQCRYYKKYQYYLAFINTACLPILIILAKMFWSDKYYNITYLAAI